MTSFKQVVSVNQSFLWSFIAHFFFFFFLFSVLPLLFAGTHLYTWVQRGTVRVKCLAQEHNTMSPARARTRTARSGDERTNHEATAPPTNLGFFKATFPDSHVLKSPNPVSQS